MTTTLTCATAVLATLLSTAALAESPSGFSDTRPSELPATRVAGASPYVKPPADNNGLALPANACLALAALGAMGILARRRGIR